MIILACALAFGLAVLVILVANMGLTLSSGFRGNILEKFRGVLKILLLIEVLGFIVLFVMVIMKTMML